MKNVYLLAASLLLLLPTTFAQLPANHSTKGAAAGAPGGYCVPTSANGTSDGDFIDSFSMGTILNGNTGSTGGSDYWDYTTQTTTLTEGNSYTAIVASGDWPTGFPDTYAVFIDYNMDDDFDDANEFLGSFLSQGQYVSELIQFTVPTGISSGTTRLRVRGVYINTGDPDPVDPCWDYAWGETEDYGIVLQSLAGGGYCDPLTTNGTQDGDYIDGVGLGSILNFGTGSTGGSDYNDYTGLSTSLMLSSNYDVTVVSGSWPGTFADDYAVWIDYNQDDDFDDANEFLGAFESAAPNTAQQINFTVPASATLGQTRMRVRGAYINTGDPDPLDPCWEYGWGETEDYTIDIIPQGGGGGYCDPLTTNGTGDGDYIDGVVLETIINSGTGSQGGPDYNDYTGFSATLNLSTTYSIDITSGSWPGTFADDYAVWIDFNQDDDFDDFDEFLGSFESAAPNTTQQITFAVPATATLGSTRMRVRGAYINTGDPDPLDPCWEYGWGETEDYTIVIQSQGGGGYCDPLTTNGTGDGDYIDGVVLESIINTGTGSQGGPDYTDYTGLSTDLTIGNGYNVEVISGSWPGTFADDYAVWIDYNQDDDFDDAGEFLGSFESAAPNTAQQISFTVPQTAMTGQTRMRVRGAYIDAADPDPLDPCWEYGWGETEDYTVNLLPNTGGPYCEPMYISGTGDGDFIDGVQLGSINNTSTGSTGGAYYNDYTAQSTQLDEGQPYSLAITSGDWPATFPDNYGAWIDYNQDGDFDDANEFLGQFESSATFTTELIVFTVPTGIANGQTRMRIIGVFIDNGDPDPLDPCYDYAWGEIEDYTVDIQAQACPTITVTPTVTDPSCGGSDGSISVTASGGQAPFSFNWSNGGTADNITGLSAGAYSVTVTDINACTGTATVGLVDAGAPDVFVATTDESCAGNDGTAFASASGGNTPYTFSWSNGGSSDFLAGLSAGSYAVTVYGSDGCAGIGIGVVNGTAAISLSTSASDAACGANDGSATAFVSGGTAPYTYSWDGGTGFQTTETATGLGAGNYNVTVTDANGCSEIATESIGSLGAPTVSASATDASCGSADGAVSLSLTGGTSPFNYTWSNGASGQAISNLMPGTYSYTVTDASGCIAFGSATVDQPDAPGVFVFSNNSTCGNDDGSATASAFGGTSPLHYHWSSNAGIQFGTTATGLSAGTYGVTVVDASNCSVSESFTISDADGPSADVISTDISCHGANDGSASVEVWDGVAPFTYNWNNGSPQSTLYNLPAGTHMVTVTDGAGCTAILTAYISEPDALVITASTTGTDPGSCTGGGSASVFGGTSPYSYAWGDNGFSASPTASNLCAGAVTLVVQDANGCFGTYQTSVGTNVGIEVATHEPRLAVFPNPTNGLLMIDLATVAANADFKIFNSNGQLVDAGRINAIGQATVLADLTSLSDGLYLVLVSTGGQQLKQTIVLAR